MLTNLDNLVTLVAIFSTCVMCCQCAQIDSQVGMIIWPTIQQEVFEGCKLFIFHMYHLDTKIKPKKILMFQNLTISNTCELCPVCEVTTPL